MLSTPNFGRLHALRLVGGGHARRIDLRHAEFLLGKAAETVIPIKVLTNDGDKTTANPGQINCVHRYGEMLHVYGSECRLHLRVSLIDTVWITRKTAATGLALSVEFFDRNSQPIVRFSGQRRNCIAWRALVEWMLLRETQDSPV